MKSNCPYLTLPLIILVAVCFAPVTGILIEKFNPDSKRFIKNNPVYELADHWEYQWENPDTRTIHTKGWKPARSIVNPPGRNQRNILWLKTIIPDIHPAEPAILIDGQGILVAFEMFIEDTVIYRFGWNDSIDQGRFTGMTSHLVNLEDDFSGKTLYFRIFSDYTNIGSRGKIFFGSRSALIQSVIKKDMTGLIIALFLVSVGILDLLIHKNRMLSIGSVSMNGLFAIGLGFYTINTISLKDLFFFAPAFWFNIYIAGLSLIPVGLMGFIWQFFRPVKGNFYHRLWQFNLVYAFVCQISSVLSLLGILSIGAATVPLTGLRMLIAFEFILILVVCVKDTVIKKDRLAMIYLFGFLPILVTGIYGIFVAFGIVTYPFPFVPPAMLVFILSLEIIQRKRNIMLQEKLRMYTDELELKSNEKLELIRDLHDGVGGTVTNIKFISQMGLRHSSEQEKTKSFSTISELSSNCMTEIDNFMQSLDDQELSWKNLTTKMVRLSETKLKPLGIDVDFRQHIEDSVKKPSSLVYLNLLRIYQEALTNIVKHARANHVLITIDAADNEMRMVIEDDGIGFGKGIKPNGRGLSNMQARVRRFKGSFHVESQKGTCIKIKLAL